MRLEHHWMKTKSEVNRSQMRAFIRTYVVVIGVAKHTYFSVLIVSADNSPATLFHMARSLLDKEMWGKTLTGLLWRIFSRSARQCHLTSFRVWRYGVCHVLYAIWCLQYADDTNCISSPQLTYVILSQSCPMPGGCEALNREDLDSTLGRWGGFGILAPRVSV